MNHVRQKIGHQLLDILHQCNMADVNDGPNCNDLNHRAAADTYRHIAEALTSLGFNRARELYAAGEKGEAHSEIDAQYGVAVKYLYLNVLEHVDMAGGAS